MMHNTEMLDSFDEYIKCHKRDNVTDIEMFNNWVRETNQSIHDADTAVYYLQAVPIAKEAYNNEVFSW